jgi:single-stranded-DNA-specific exonuclease
LNASGRIEDAIGSLKILLNESFDDKKIEELVLKLDTLNTERQKLQQSIFKEIEESSDFSTIKKNKKVFISMSAGWSEGVLGVVASDIVKKHNIPAILFKENRGVLKGSGRSMDSFSLYDNLADVKKYFIKFGGHRMACGITMEAEKFDVFKKCFEEIACSIIKDEEVVKRFYYDLEISFDDIDERLLKEIKLMAPFGIGNQKPVFLTRKCLIASDISCSKNGKHVFFQIKNSNRVYNAVVFNYLENKDSDVVLLKGNSIDILYSIEQYNNKTRTKDPMRIVIQSFR